MFVTAGYRIPRLLRGISRGLGGLIGGLDRLQQFFGGLFALAAASSAGLLSKEMGTLTSLSPFWAGRELTPLNEPTVSSDSTLFDSALIASSTWLISDSVNAISFPSLY